jgi:hypothetical protein
VYAPPACNVLEDKLKYAGKGSTPVNKVLNEAPEAKCAVRLASKPVAAENPTVF